MAQRRTKQRLNDGEMNRGIRMLQASMSQRQVAADLGVSQSVVARMWNRLGGPNRSIKTPASIAIRVIEVLNPPTTKR